MRWLTELLALAAHFCLPNSHNSERVAAPGVALMRKIWERKKKP